MAKVAEMEYALQAKNVNVGLRGLLVMKNFTLSACFGEVTGIIGPNGAGKSTLLKAILGLCPLKTGIVDIEGVNAKTLKPHERAQLMAYVPQKTMLNTPLSVYRVIKQARMSFRENPETTQMVIHSSLEKVGILQWQDRIFTHLSGGEQRMVLIARALAANAKIVLLDEPTASLDIYHTLKILKLLRYLAIKHQLAIIMVHHDIEDMRHYADQVLVLKGGVSLVQGKAHQALSDHVIQSVYHVGRTKNCRSHFHLLTDD